MKHFPAIAWASIGAGWLAAFFFLGNMVGGIRWIGHTGLTIPAGLNLLMAALSFASVYHLYAGSRIPGSLSIPIFLLALLHLLNLFPPVSYLFVYLFSVILRTNTAFTNAIPGYATLLVLPIASMSLLWLKGNERPAADA
ncbi:hypothetical protein [Polaromonas sp.]|uniref:hypothetical protein n=1 Tax=Polaromonas sp. TaxID=1869339 RepID=UPI003CBC8FE4